LADKWSKSEDGRRFDFHLREGARWSDGEPVMVEDVLFSFNAIFDNRYEAAHLRPFYSAIEKVTPLGDGWIRFHVKSPYYRNFVSAATLRILPKHLYGGRFDDPRFHRNVYGSGPSQFHRYTPGHSIELRKTPFWWGADSPDGASSFSAPRVLFRFVREANVALEMMRKDRLDYLPLGFDLYRGLATGTIPDRGIRVVKARNAMPRGIDFI